MRNANNMKQIAMFYSSGIFVFYFYGVNMIVII